jgi:hypothetical protein
MAIQNVAQRIKAAIEKRTVRAGADATETHEITIEQGTEVVRNRVGVGQIESSIHFSKWQEADPQPKVIRPADIVDANPKPVEESAIVKIGDRVTIAPSPILGTFEATFTRNFSPYDVKVDGKIVSGDAAFRALYDALREQQASKRK